MSALRRRHALLATLTAFALAATALPAAVPAAPGPADTSWPDALADLRAATRDTLGHPADGARLDALGGALLRVARLPEAERVFRQALALNPADHTALAGLGRIALCAQRDAEAESLLVRAGGAEGAAADLYRLELRRRRWAIAATMAEAQGEPGRREMLERLAELPPAPAPAGPERAKLTLLRAWPAPLVRVRLNGQTVTMAVDPGAAELLLDPSATRACRVSVAPGERTVGWSGVRVTARNAIADRLELGGFVLTGMPAAVTPLHRYSLEVNPGSPDIAGVIGLPVLERFAFTLDLAKQVVELARPGTPADAPGVRVPFERWGDNELTVYGSLSGGRRMAFWVGTGLPAAGIGASAETFAEAGIVPGRIANLVRGASTMLQGRAWSLVTVPSVSVGGVSREKVEGLSGAMDASESWRWGIHRDGVLGPRFFADRRVTFDWARRELLFEDRR